MKCPKCFGEVAAGEKFCGACGSEITALAGAATDAPKPAQKPWLAPALGVAALLFGSGGYLVYRNIITPNSPVTPQENSAPAPEAPKPPGNPQPPPQQPQPQTLAPPPTQPPTQSRQTPLQSPVSPPPDRPAPAVVTRPDNQAPQSIPIVPAPPKPEKPHADIIKPEPPPQAPVKPPEKPPDAPPPPSYNGPRSGVINWSGQIDKNGVIAFDGGSASIGTVNGKLPGVPVMLEIDTREFAFAELPAPSNGWSRFAIRSRNRRHVVISIKWSVIE